MSRTAQRLRAQPLLSFFALTCALSWWTWAIPALHLPIFPPGPFVAAWLVLRFGGERDAALALASSLVRWRVPARALAFVLSAPPLLVALSIGGDVALGAAWPTRVVWLDRSHLLLLFPLLLLVPAAGGAWSEPGFRGYALPRLLERGSPLVATLVLGVVVSVWHLPLPRLVRYTCVNRNDQAAKRDQVDNRPGREGGSP